MTNIKSIHIPSLCEYTNETNKQTDIKKIYLFKPNKLIEQLTMKI